MPTLSMKNEHEYDYQSSFKSSNNNQSWAGPVEMFMRNWESSSASRLGSIVSMTGYWDAYKLHIPVAMMMISSEQNPPSMPPRQDEAHTRLGDFTNITMSNSNNDVHFIQVTSER